VDAISTEIIALEQRAALARLRDRHSADDGRPDLAFRRNNDDDESPSGLSSPPLSAASGPTAIVMRSPRVDSSLPPSLGDTRSQSDCSILFSGLSLRAMSPPEEFSLPPGQSDDSFADFSFESDARPLSLGLPSRPNACVDFLGSGPLTTVRKLILLSQRVLRRVLAAKESIFKYGTFVPKNDREADSSPEASRWKAGRTLEWLRLEQHGTFDGDWTWDKVCRTFPLYKKSDVGFLFYVYDFKFSGEHRVRFVFDGSRQSASTYSETYAPTVRAESVRLFHIVCVEEGYHIGQYDVPQAFLKADIDHDIVAYPPKGQGLFPGQILKLRRALYGGKQSAFLWFQMMNVFLLELGFKPSSLDSCLYRRADALLILNCDDLRIGASPAVLCSLHASLLAQFEVTTAPGNRFLGMDTIYDLEQGHLKLSMSSYIDMTLARFRDFDLSQ
jgi:hypothetical protein